MALYFEKIKKDTKHNLHPYVQLFQDDLSNFPIFYNNDSLNRIKGSLLESSVIVNKAILSNVYKDLKEYAGVEISEEDFLKNYFISNSRNISNEKEATLVPAIDLIQLDPDNFNVRLIFNKDTNQFEVVSEKDIAKKESLKMSVDLKDNKVLLLNYGTSIDNSTEEYKNNQKLSILLENNETIEIAYNNYNILENAKIVTGNTKVTNKIDYLVSFTNFFKNAVLSYPTSLEDDLKNLEEEKSKGQSTSNLGILRVLIEEKEIVYNGYDICNALLYLLAYPDDFNDLRNKASISVDLEEWIKSNFETIRERLEKAELKLYPVHDSELYKREDVTKFLELFAKEKKKRIGNKKK